MRIEWQGSHRADGFRSALEGQVASELDHLGVTYLYEEPWTRESDGYRPRYLPDFTVEAASTALDLPRWIEVKPMQQLYDLRDVTGFTRRVGEHFTGSPEYAGITALDLRDRFGVPELWKPKMLAEVAAAEIGSELWPHRPAVLCIGKVGGTASLSIEMRADSIVFCRSHPLVNQVGVKRRVERERQRKEAEILWQRREAERQERLHQFEAERKARQQQRKRDVAAVLAFPDGAAPRFASPCYGCDRTTDRGTRHHVEYSDGSKRWTVVCHECAESARR